MGLYYNNKKLIKPLRSQNKYNAYINSAKIWETKINAIAFSSTKIARSESGNLWSINTSSIGARDALWCSTLGAWFAVTGSTYVYKSSDDGTSWSSVEVPGAWWYKIVWSPSLHRFVMVGYVYGGGSGSGRVAYSSDGVSWTIVNTSSYELYSVDWSPTLSRFVLVGNSIVKYSANGISWSNTNLTSNRRNDVVWCAGLSKFIALGSNTSPGNNYVAYSSNGISWTEVNAGSPFYRGAWSSELSLFVAVGSNIGVSPDGISWTITTAPAALYDVAWLPFTSRFVVAGYWYLGYTFDGVTVQKTSSESGSWDCIASKA
jgi:hypothetical protein